MTRHPRTTTSTRTPKIPVQSVNGAAPPSRSLVEFAAYVDGTRVEAESIVEALALVRDHHEIHAPDAGARAFVWVGLHEPKAHEVEWLAKVFDLHPLAVEDAVNAHQRPKVERYGDSLFVVLKTLAFLDNADEGASSDIIAAGEIMAFVGRDFVVTVRHGEQCPLSEVRARLESKPELLGRGATGVLYAVADHVVDRYLHVADLMQQELEEVEATVFASVSSRDIGRIYQLKREMIDMKRAVTPLVAPLATLAQRRQIPSDMRDYFRDVVDHLTRVCEQVELSNELCNSVLQAALARSNALVNEDMRRITSWVAIMAVPTMIAGIYGMNFDHMPLLRSPYGYPVVLAVIVVVCALLYRGFRRNGWLGVKPPRA
ncbi:magnesium/cobalt transporter CorA [Sinosporangium album]|nr:magnesium/cobalt transporter CorA [Sinosporangium album]